MIIVRGLELMTVWNLFKVGKIPEWNVNVVVQIVVKLCFIKEKRKINKTPKNYDKSNAVIYGVQQGLHWLACSDRQSEYYTMITMPKLCDQSRIGIDRHNLQLHLGDMKWDKSKQHTS